MSNADREMLADYMSRALARVIDALDAIDDLSGRTGWDDWDDLPESVQDYLEDLGMDAESWDADTALDRVREDLDPLSITWEKGEPFDVALSLGGPNICLVDFGGHGGAQLRGYWGETHVMTGPDVTRALEHYREEMRDIYGD